MNNFNLIGGPLVSLNGKPPSIIFAEVPLGHTLQFVTNVLEILSRLQTVRSQDKPACLICAELTLDREPALPEFGCNGVTRRYGWEIDVMSDALGDVSTRRHGQPF